MDAWKIFKKNKEKALNTLTAYLAIGWLFGVLLSEQLAPLNIIVGGLWWIWFIGVILMCINRSRVASVIILLLGIIGGVSYSAPFRINFRMLTDYIGQEIIVSGEIADDPTKQAGKWRVNLTNINVSNKDKNINYRGQIWASLVSDTELRRHDKITINGIADSGFSNYPIKVVEGRIIDHRAAHNYIDQARASMDENLRKTLPDQSADLAMGLLAGQKLGMSVSLMSWFLVAGLSHILVASGYNLTVVTRIARRWLTKYSRASSSIVIVALIIGFSQLAGWSASMARATIVTIMSLAVWYVGRTVHPVKLLVIAAAITSAFNPTELWGSLSWYLSFTAFAGVILLAPSINEIWLIKEKKVKQEDDIYPKTIAERLEAKYGKTRGALIQLFTETVSAQIATLPIVLYFIGTVSVISLLTNILVLPFIPLAMLLSTILFVVNMLGLGVIGALIAGPTQFVLDYIIQVAKSSADIPFAMLNYSINLWQLVVMYVVMIIACWWWARYRKHNFNLDNVIE